MNCNEAMDILSLYIDDQLSSQEKELFEQHIASCDKCKEELVYMQNIIKNVSNLDEEKELPKDFHENLLIKIDNIKVDRYSDRKITKIKSFRKYYTAIAALFMVAIIFGVIKHSNINMNNSDECYETTQAPSREDITSEDIYTAKSIVTTREKAEPFVEINKEVDEAYCEDIEDTGDIMEKSDDSIIMETNDHYKDIDMIEQDFKTDSSTILDNQDEDSSYEPVENNESIHEQTKVEKKSNKNILYIISTIIGLVIIVSVLWIIRNKRGKIKG